MAGDWLKIEKDTPEKPEMYRLAQLLGISQAEAFLACFRVWRWADGQTQDGVIHTSQAAIDDNAKVPNFHHALSEVGWLNLRTGAVELPNFIRHMGMSAKKRCGDAVRKMSAREADKKRTKSGPEKRREEKKEEGVPSSLPRKRGSKKPPARDELLDALVELTGADPGVNGSHLGRVCKALRKADPPYTTAELRRLPQAAADAGLPSFTLTLGAIEKHIGLVRKMPALTEEPSRNGSAHGESPDEVFARVKKRVAEQEARQKHGADVG